MATVAREINKPRSVPAAGLEPTPVIADSGGAVRVILVRFPGTPEAGDRFTFEGTRWEVVHPKDHVRGCVARPCLSAAS